MRRKLRKRKSKALTNSSKIKNIDNVLIEEHGVDKEDLDCVATWKKYQAFLILQSDNSNEKKQSLLVKSLGNEHVYFIKNLE